jgi:hypothetical protein
MYAVRQVGYDPSTGKRKVLQLGTFDTKRAANERTRSVAGGRVGTSAETVGDYVANVWLLAKEGRVERSTFDQYRWAVDRHIGPLIGAVQLRDLTPELVDGWIREPSVGADGGKPRLGSTSTPWQRCRLGTQAASRLSRQGGPAVPQALSTRETAAIYLTSPLAGDWARSGRSRCPERSRRALG